MLDNRLAASTKSHKHIKPPPEMSPEMIQKENRMLLERLMIISKRKREKRSVK